MTLVRKLYPVALAAFVLWNLAGATGVKAQSAADAQAPAVIYKWRMPTSLPASDPYIVRQRQMIDRIKARTHGAVNITLYPGDTLMRSDDMAKAVGAGTVEMDSVGAVFYDGVSDIAAILTPGTVGISTDDTLKAIAPGTEGRKIVEAEWARLGIKPLSFWNQTDIGLVSFVPLNTVASFKGKKLRVSSDIAAAVLRALNAEPTVMGGSEALDAMRQHIIDGSTCHPTCIQSRGYMDFAKFYTPWTVVPNVGVLNINLKLWNSLPKEIQDVIQQEADAAAKDQTELVPQIQGRAMWELALQNGISLAAIAPSEQTTLRNIARPIFENFVKSARPQPQASDLAALMLKANGQQK